MGNILGDILPFNHLGIDFSMSALFMIILINQIEKTKNRISIIASLLISVLCLFVFGADRFLIPTMFLIVIMLLIIKRGEIDA